MTEQRRGFIPKIRKQKSFIPLSVFLLLIFLSGCYGPFPITLAVYKANGSVPTGIFRNLVFWLLLIIPVYEIALTIDIVILNLIEFWIPGTQFDNLVYDDARGRKVSMLESEDGKTAHLTVSDDEKVLLELEFIKVSDTMCEVRDTDGVLLGSVQFHSTGDLELTDGHGRIIKSLASTR